MKKTTKLFALAGLLLTTTATFHAAVILNWVEWVAPGSYPFFNNDALAYNYASGTTGSITLPNSSVVGVTLSGEVMGSYSASAFGTANNAYWNTRNYAGSTYLGANVPSLPSNSDRIWVGGYGISQQTLTFDAPVSNIVMNVWSLGNPELIGSWSFNQPFVILSQNAGQNPGTPFALQASANNTLSGYEGAGTIQFTGTFTNLS